MGGEMKNYVSILCRRGALVAVAIGFGFLVGILAGCTGGGDGLPAESSTAPLSTPADSPAVSPHLSADTEQLSPAGAEPLSRPKHKKRAAANHGGGRPARGGRR